MQDLIYLPLAEKHFNVSFSICSNPDCELAHFSLNEAKDYGNPIDINISTITWEYKKINSHEIAQELFDELLKELLASLDRNEVLDRFKNFKEELSNFLNYSISREKVLEGELIAYSSAATSGKSLYDGGDFYCIKTKYQDQEFLVEELYCPNPDCHCNEVDFLFFSLRNERVIPTFRVTWLFSGKIKAIDNLSNKFTKKQIQNIFKSSLDNENLTDKSIINHHYKQIKEIGKRGLNSVQSSLDIPTKSIKIGRNDPCPCNSGKKYKKCCMNK